MKNYLTVGIKLVNYYLKETNKDSSFLIVNINKEIISFERSEVLGKIIYCSNNPRLVNTFWRKNKADISYPSPKYDGAIYEFSKRGFEIPKIENNIPYQPLIKIPPIGNQI